MKKICASILLVSSSVFGVTFVDKQVNQTSQPGLIEVGNPSQNDNLQNVLSRDGFNEEAFQELLNSGADINEEIKVVMPLSFRTRGALFFYNGKGTRLFHATRFNDEELVAWLVDHGADVNKATADGYTPLIVASALGNRNLMQYLLEHGADINATTTNGESPLTLSFKSRDLDLCRYLIENGAKIDNEVGATILLRSIFNGNKEFVEYLIAHGADINRGPKGGYPPLLAALVINNHPLIELFIGLGAEVKGLKDGIGMTPTFLALRNGCNKEILSYLIKNGDDANAKVKGHSLLLVISQYGDENLIRLLVEKGANVNVTDRQGKTPLFFAVQNKNSSLTQFLLEHGATGVQKECSWRDSPLSLAKKNAQYDQDPQKREEWEKIISMMEGIIKKQQ